MKSHKFGEWGREQGWESDVAMDCVLVAYICHLST
jgi:hypothetical protein